VAGGRHHWTGRFRHAQYHAHGRKAPRVARHLRSDRAMDDETDRTAELLTRWHAGDRDALGALLARDLPWLKVHVHQRLGPVVRAGGDTEDLVQEAVVSFLENGPRFVVSDRDQFRALLGRVAANTLCNVHDFVTAQRRDRRREISLSSRSSIRIDQPADPRAQPSEVVAAAESQAWIQIGLEFLDPDDRKVILLRDWDERPFAEMGKELGIDEDAARMRYRRALPRLARIVRRLQQGRLSALLEEAGAQDGAAGGAGA
jgi:RNA polymerase sigma factor (sigma-70 family)